MNDWPSDENTNTEDTAGKTDRGHGLVHGRTTHAVLAAAYRVHGQLGPGLLERVYQLCLCHELSRAGIPFEFEKSLPVLYDDVVIELGYRIDLLVDSKVVVEVKAIEAILPVHESQLLTYLRLSRIRVGLLINFRRCPASRWHSTENPGFLTVSSVCAVSSVFGVRRSRRC